MSNFSKTLRAANTAASIVIAIGVAVDLYDRFKGSFQKAQVINPTTETADDTVSSVMVGQMVSDSLLNLDPIAFVRFVSVYRKFSRVSDFKKIIDKIPEDDENAIVCKLPKNSLF